MSLLSALLLIFSAYVTVAKEYSLVEKGRVADKDMLSCDLLSRHIDESSTERQMIYETTV